MKKKLMILAGLFMMFQLGFSNSCTMGYKLEKSKVYYYDFKVRIEIKGADYQSFEIMTNTLAKDKDNIYYIGKKVVGINPETFKIKEEYTKRIICCIATSYVIEDNGNEVFLEYINLKNEK